MADNQKMWADLGMNLEMHDMLCAVLPGAIGDVFMSQENRPEAMDYFDMVLADVHGLRPAELVEFRKNGGKVFGTFCAYVPDEVIVAAGAIATGLCAGSQFWVPGGERYLPANTCPLIKAMLGARFDKTCPFYRLADVYIGENTCDGKKKAYEILGTDVPMHIMDLPQMKREKDYLKWADEIKDLKALVEKETGTEVTAEKLAEAIKLINAKRAALERLYKLRRNENVPISGTDTLLISQIAYYDDPARFTAMVNKLCDELDKRVADGVSVAAGKKRILISGTPMAIPNWKLHNLVETSGGVVVCEETCTGTRYFENQVDESGATVDEMIQNIATQQELMTLSDWLRKAKQTELSMLTSCSARPMTSREEASRKDARQKASHSSVLRQTTLTTMLSRSRQESAHSSKCSANQYTSCTDTVRRHRNKWGGTLFRPIVSEKQKFMIQ